MVVWWREQDIDHDFICNRQSEKKHLFWSNRKFVFFFQLLNLRKIREKKIGETNWWTYLMNSLIDLWRNLEGGKRLRKSHHLEDVLVIPVTAEKITNLGKGPFIYSTENKHSRTKNGSRGSKNFIWQKNTKKSKLMVIKYYESILSIVIFFVW